MKNYSNTYSFKRKYVYFEKQSGRFCGLHCINSLLQGPFFDAISLSQIGMKLNDMELKLLDSTSKLYHKNANVDDDGNFNIQVLSEALKIHGCEIRHLKHNEILSIAQSNNYEHIDAFIFNSSTHWFTVRKIDGIWFNLNSTNHGPEIINDFQISSFIKENENIGYTNFIVTNLPRLPDIKSSLFQYLQPNQYLIPFETLTKNLQYSQHNTSYENNYVNKTKSNYVNEDVETMQACQVSLNEYIEQIKRDIPPEPYRNGFIVNIYYNKEVFTRKWNGNDKIRHLKKFVQSKIPTTNKIELFESFPRRIYSNDEATLMQCGFALIQTLHAKTL